MAILLLVYQQGTRCQHETDGQTLPTLCSFPLGDLQITLQTLSLSDGIPFISVAWDHSHPLLLGAITKIQLSPLLNEYPNHQNWGLYSRAPSLVTFYSLVIFLVTLRLHCLKIRQCSNTWSAWGTFPLSSNTYCSGLPQHGRAHVRPVLGNGATSVWSLTSETSIFSTQHWARSDPPPPLWSGA